MSDYIFPYWDDLDYWAKRAETNGDGLDDESKNTLEE